MAGHDSAQRVYLAGSRRTARGEVAACFPFVSWSLIAFFVRVYEYAAIASALLVFPALIFLGWWDAAVGSIVPLIMLAVIMATLENTDPEYSIPKHGALKGKLAVVVGASRGIGLGVVQEFVRQGAQVVVANRGAFDQSRVNASDDGGRVLGSVSLDLSDPASVSSFAARLRKEVPAAASKVDVLVLNAGAFCLSSAPSASLDETVVVNAAAPARLVESLLPQLRGGSVLLSSSASSRQWEGGAEGLLAEGVEALPEEAAHRMQVCLQRYARSKALANAFALELGEQEQEIKVHAVFPNPTNTDMLVQGMEELARVVRYPSFFAPGTRLFDEFNRFWVKLLSRSIERVAAQYVYGAMHNNTLETNGCAFFGERCLKPQPFEVEVVGKVRSFLLQQR